MFCVTSLFEAPICSAERRIVSISETPSLVSAALCFIASAAFSTPFVTAEMISPISSAAVAVFSERFLISSATTAKPEPASPA